MVGWLQLEKAVMEGQWKEVEEVAGSADLGLSGRQLAKCCYAVKRQEYLELLAGKQTEAAMACLQQHLTPLAPDAAQVHKLARLLVCADVHELCCASEWRGSGVEGRRLVLEEVRRCLPAATLMPKGRLRTLVSQSLEHQMRSCPRYNRAQQWTNLVEDCWASEELVPRQTRHVLEEHADEVWHIDFSHCGGYLASASKDKTVIIWALLPQPRIRHHLKAHTGLPN